MPILYIPLGNLITRQDKYDQTAAEISRGELSFSFGEPCTVTYCPDVRKWLIMDGNHRAIEKAMQGQKKISCEINPHVRKMYPTGNFITLTKKKFAIQ